MPVLPSTVGFAECTSQSCPDITSSLLSYIDHNVDPCDNFYQYSCGAWIKNNTIPDYSGIAGSFTEIDLEIKDSIITLLSGSYEDLLKLNIAPDFIDGSSQDTDKEIFDKLKTHYETCMDTATIDKLGPTPIYPLLSSYYAIQNTTDLLIAAGQANVWPFISVKVDRELTNPHKSAIWILSSSLTLGSPSYYASSETLQLYQTLLAELVSAVLSPNQTTYQEAAHQANLTLLSQQEISGLVERFIKLEAQIANISASVAASTSIETYSHGPISSLQTDFPVVSWPDYLRAFVPEEGPLPGSIPSYYDPNYLGNVSALLQATETGAIREFVAIKTILAFAKTLDTPISQINTNLLGSLVYGITALPPRDQVCAGRVQKGFDRAVSRYLVMATIGGEEERDRIIELVENNRQTWVHRLEALDWLDSETRANALNKVQKTAYWVTYSLKSPDLRAPASVRDYYSSLDVTSESYFANELAVSRFLGAYNPWQGLGVPRQRNELSGFDWAIANAFYIPTQNMIAILPGILRRPAYEKEGPLYVNYGAIGFIIAHEFSHGFDTNGRLFDAEGRLTNWWTNTTTQIFEEKTKCFVDQYNNFTVTGPNNTVINVNGELTISENIADNAGLSISYETFQGVWKNASKSEQSSVAATNLTPDQLFFISQAHFFCANMIPEIVLVNALIDTHAPPEWRVNGVMQNSEAFSNAFQCPKESKMNPEQKCVLW